MPSQAIVHVVRGGGARTVSRICSQFEYLTRRGRLGLQMSARHGNGFLPHDEFRTWADRWAAQAGNYVNGQAVGDADQAMTTHIVVSFPPGTDPAAAHRAGRSWAEDMFGALHNDDVFDYLTAFHIDREHPHLHVIVNRRSLSAGHGWLKIARRNEAINYDLMRARLVLNARKEGIDLRADYRVPAAFGPAPAPLPVRQAIEVQEHWGDAAGQNGHNPPPGPGGGAPPGGGRPPFPPGGGPAGHPPSPSAVSWGSPFAADWPSQRPHKAREVDVPGSKARKDAANQWFADALQDGLRSEFYNPKVLQNPEMGNRLQAYRREFGEPSPWEDLARKRGYKLADRSDQQQRTGDPELGRGGEGASVEPGKGARSAAGSKRSHSYTALDGATPFKGAAAESGPSPPEKARPDQELPVSRHNPGSGGGGGVTEQERFDEPHLPDSSLPVVQPPAGGYDSDELYREPTPPRQTAPRRHSGGFAASEPSLFSRLSPSNPVCPDSSLPGDGDEADDFDRSPTPSVSPVAQPQHHDGSDGGSGSNMLNSYEGPVSESATPAVDEQRRRRAETSRLRASIEERRGGEQQPWAEEKSVGPRTDNVPRAGATPVQETSGVGRENEPVSETDSAAEVSPAAPAAPRVAETPQERAARLLAAKVRRRGDDVDWNIETRARYHSRRAAEEAQRVAQETQEIEEGPVAGRTRRAKRDRDSTR